MAFSLAQIKDATKKHNAARDEEFLQRETEEIYREASIDQACSGWESVRERIKLGLRRAYDRGKKACR